MFHINNIIFGVIVLMHFVKCDEPYCHTVRVGLEPPHVLVLDAVVTSHLAVDVLEVGQQCHGLVVGLVAYACYREDFNMTIDENSKLLKVSRPNSDSSLEINLKIYCDELFNGSTTVVNLITESTENPTVLNVEEVVVAQKNIDKAQKSIDKAKLTANTAKESVDRAEDSVNEVLKEIQQSEVDAVQVQANVEKTFQSLALAQLSIEKAQKTVDKAQKAADKAHYKVLKALPGVEEPTL